MQEKIPVIFLASYGHSGSTLLDLMFARHSKIVSGGGLSGYNTYDIRKRFREKRNRISRKCSCGAEVNSCPFFSKVMEGLDISHGLGIYPRSRLGWLAGKTSFSHWDGVPVDIDSFIALNETIYTRMQEATGKKFVFDSSREPYRLELLARSEKIEPILLHLVRGGLGCVSSMKKREPGALRPSVSWMLRNLEIESFKRRHSGLRNIFVHYDAFVQKPREVVSGVLDQLGLAFEPGMMRFRTGITHNCSGNAHKQDKSKPEVIVADSSWQERITNGDRLVFNVIAGWLDRRYRAKGASISPAFQSD
jgi:hypothetical protein